MPATSEKLETVPPEFKSRGSLNPKDAQPDFFGLRFGCAVVACVPALIRSHGKGGYGAIEKISLAVLSRPPKTLA